MRSTSRDAGFHTLDGADCRLPSGVSSGISFTTGCPITLSIISIFSSKTEDEKKAMSNDQMPFTQHLEELRKRLVVSAIAVGIGFLISYAFKEKIFEVLMQPWIQALPKGQEAKLTRPSSRT